MHYFFLGNTPLLSWLELESIAPHAYSEVLPGILKTELTESDMPKIKLAGGLRKMALHHGTYPRTAVLTHLTNALNQVQTKNVAITDYASLSLTKSDLHNLKKSGTRPLRFVSMETTEHELIMLAHQHVTELNLLPDQDHGLIHLAQTSWIFDAEDWVKRDRAKPYRDIKRGMLPAKLARVLVNLAFQGTPSTLYDPFCGTGTVLTEAALCGATTLYGSDNNPEAVKGAALNLDWIKSSYELLTLDYQLLLADATHPPIQGVNCIATEPYMGPLLTERNPLPVQKIKDIAKGLDKLYRGALKSWLRVLPVGGRVVITLPSFAVYGRVIPTISVDTIVTLGYNYISSVAYGKPGATVIRNITIIEKK